MWKRISGALDAVLSFVGLITVLVVGVRYWRGLPPVPPNLFSATPAAAPPKPATPPKPDAAGPQATVGAAAPKPEATAPAAAAPTAAPLPTATVSTLKMAHEWGREVAVTVNASRYVKSLADVAPPPASLPEDARRQLKAALALTKSSEMLLVCNVTVEYSGAEEVTLDQSGFKLVSPDNQVFPSVPIPFSTRDLQPLRATLLANGSAKGDLVFAVKRGVQPDQVIYQP